MEDIVDSARLPFIVGRWLSRKVRSETSVEKDMVAVGDRAVAEVQIDVWCIRGDQEGRKCSVMAVHALELYPRYAREPVTRLAELRSGLVSSRAGVGSSDQEV